MTIFSAYETERIKFMRYIAKEVSKNEPAVLKGGTALLLNYGLDRFSEDMDFNLPKGMVSDFRKHIMKAAQYMDNITVKDIIIKKDTDTTKRYMVHYESSFEKSFNPLKIECSMRQEINNNEFETRDGINVYTVKQLVQLKTDAFVNRAKGRDTYDIAFLLNNYPNDIDKETWERIEKHVKTKGIDDLYREYEKDAEKDKLLSKYDGMEVVLSLYEALDNNNQKVSSEENTYLKTANNTEKTKEADFNPQKAHLQTEAIESRIKAQAAHEVVAKAKTIPQGMDFNLPNADLNHTQENVFAETLSSDTDVKILQADATSKDDQASKISKLDAITTAKNIMGKDAIVTSSKSGETYQGEIIAKTDIYAIQRITSNQAVLHEIIDISDEANTKAGAKITLFNRGDKTIIQENIDYSQELEQDEELEEGHERERGSR